MKGPVRPTTRRLRLANRVGVEPAGRQRMTPTPSQEAGDAAEEESGGWSICYVTPVEAEAHVVRGFLEQYGIPCVIREDRLSAHPLTFCAFGTIEILVPADWIQVARGVIEGRQRGRRSGRARSTGLRAVEGRHHG